MKTKFLALALSVLAFSAADAQSFHLGIKGGANINKIPGKSFKDEFNFGYQLGGFAELGISKSFSIQPEVLFNESKYKYDSTGSFSDVYKVDNLSKVKLNYLTIPILLSYHPSNILSIQAGPQFGIMMDQNVKLIQNGKDAFKKGDFSLLAGVQLKFSNIRVYGRYAVGLNNVNELDNQEKWKSQGFQIGLGLAIL